MGKIERFTTAELVVQEIIRKIINGQLKNGDRLKEQELQEMFNISRAPVREAFRILQSRDIIEYTPYHGVRVRSNTQKEIEDYYDVQTVLQVYAVRYAAERATEGDVTYLEGVLREMHLLSNDDILGFRMLDDKFHLYICELSGNMALTPLLNTSFDKTLIMRNSSVMGKRTIHDTIREHQAIINALAAHDVKQAEEAMRGHQESGRQGALKVLENKMESVE